MLEDSFWNSNVTKKINKTEIEEACFLGILGLCSSDSQHDTIKEKSFNICV